MKKLQLSDLYNKVTPRTYFTVNNINSLEQLTIYGKLARALLYVTMDVVSFH